MGIAGLLARVCVALLGVAVALVGSFSTSITCTRFDTSADREGGECIVQETLRAPTKFTFVEEKHDGSPLTLDEGANASGWPITRFSLVRQVNELVDVPHDDLLRLAHFLITPSHQQITISSDKSWLGIILGVAMIPVAIFGGSIKGESADNSGKKPYLRKAQGEEILDDDDDAGADSGAGNDQEDDGDDDGDDGDDGGDDGGDDDNGEVDKDD